MTSATALSPVSTTSHFDPKEFRRALGCFPTGVAVITTASDTGELVGLTCNSFSSVSLEPPLVLWSLRLASKALPVFQGARGFAINVLAENQTELSARFANSTIANKFENVGFSLNAAGLPLLDECVARFECKMVTQHVEGDHVIFIGQVENFDCGQQQDPLVFCKGAYMMLTQSLRDLVTLGKISRQSLDQARTLLHVMVIRLACEHGDESDFLALEQNIRRMDEYAAQGDLIHRSEAAVEFFNLIALAGRNEVLQVLMNSLTQILRYSLLGQSSMKCRPELVDIRWKILEHLRARQAELATAEMAAYLDHLQRETR
jgi:flavin reductase (DIM6/NTAB) family NADH-FMN oxidoreductase RutF